MISVKKPKNKLMKRLENFKKIYVCQVTAGGSGTLTGLVGGGG
jgi:hypothetical protein